MKVLSQALETEEGYLVSMFCVNIEDTVQQFKKTVEITDITVTAGSKRTLRERWSRDKMGRDNSSTIGKSIKLD